MKVASAYILFVVFVTSHGILFNRDERNINAFFLNYLTSYSTLLSNSGNTVGLFNARAGSDAASSPTYSRNLATTTFTGTAENFQSWALQESVLPISGATDATLLSSATSYVNQLAGTVQAAVIAAGNINAYTAASLAANNTALSASSNADTQCEIQRQNYTNLVNGDLQAASAAANAVSNGENAQAIQYVYNSLQNTYEEVLSLANCGLVLMQAIRASDSASVAQLTEALASLYLQQSIDSSSVTQDQIDDAIDALINATWAVNEDNLFISVLQSNIETTQQLETSDLGVVNAAYSNVVADDSVSTNDITSALQNNENMIAGRLEALLVGFRSVTSVNVVVSSDTGVTTVQIRGLVINNPNELSDDQVFSLTAPEVNAIISAMGVPLNDLSTVNVDTNALYKTKRSLGRVSADYNAFLARSSIVSALTRILAMDERSISADSRGLNFGYDARDSFFSEDFLIALDRISYLSSGISTTLDIDVLVSATQSSGAAGVLPTAIFSVVLCHFFALL